MKKIAAALAAIMLIQPIAVSADVNYLDVGGHWAQKFITKLTNAKIVEGDSGYFKPNSCINVDEFIKMIVNAMNLSVEYNSGSWSEPYIKAALANNLIYSDEFDRYDRPIKRRELAKIVVRAIGADYVTGELRERLISQISDYYDIYNSDKEYVLAAYANRLLNGYEDNTFRGEALTTRAQACVITDRMINVGNFNKPSETDTNDSGVIFVSPFGDDSNDASETSPIKTLEKARDIVRERKNNGAVTVYLREGEYFLDNSLEMGALDSGTEENPVVYTSYKNEAVMITGGIKLDKNDFKPINAEAAKKLLDKSAASNVLEFDLNKAGIEDLGELSRRGYGISAEKTVQPQLYINQNAMTLAKWPNDDWVGTTEIVRSGVRSKNGVLEGAVYKIDYDRPTKWKTNINEIYTSGVLGPNYFYGYFPIEKIERGQITLKEGSVTDYYSKHFIRYSNVFEELDVPGEYYIDRDTKMLYLYPPKDFGDGCDIRLSMLDKNLIAGTNVSNVTFKNINFNSSRAGAIRLSGAKNITVENCEVWGTGTNGIYINGTGSTIKNCIIHDIGSTAVSISGGDYDNIIPSDNKVINNHIYRAAQIERSYQAGVLIGYRSVGTLVSHNEIHDMPHAGVIIYGPNHTVEYNNIYDCVKEFHDMDAIYLNVYQYPWERNVVIKRNFIHDLGQQTFTERQMNVAGIRTDNNGNGLNVLENVFYNIGYQNSNGMRGVCAQGIDNVVNSNIFVDTALTYEGAHTYNPDAKWNIQSDSVKGIYEQWEKYAPKYGEQNPEVLDFYKHHFTAYKGANKFNNNVVVNIKFPQSTLNGASSPQGFFASEELVEASGNIVTKTDPGFMDYAGKNFALKDDSEVYQKNKDFPKIDFENIGLLKDEAIGTQK